MEQNSTPSPNLSQSEIGYLVVRVSTALGAIPLQNATVNIRSSAPDASGVLYTLTSDMDGITQKVELPAPPRELSEHPGEAVPFSSWNVDVFKEGYVPVSFQSIPVYSSIVSVQPAVLVPVSERFYSEISYNESEAPDL